VAFAAYEAVKHKLSGSMVDAIKNKVTGSACGAQGDEFLISLTCAPALAAARRCAALVLQSLRWGSLYSRYTRLCKALKVRADKAAYSHAAEAANQAVRRGVTVVIAGKVRADGARAARTATFLSQKVRDSGPKEEGRPRTVALSDAGGATVAALYVSHPAPSLFGVAALDFVESGVRGKPAQLVSGVLYVLKSANAQAERLGRSDKADGYAATLSSRLKDEARPVLVFTAAQGCYVSSAALTVGGLALTAATAAAAIKLALR